MSEKITLVNPGQKLWFCVHHKRFVIPVIVVEANEVYVNPYDPKGSTVWCYRYLTDQNFNSNEKDYVAVPTGEIDENGWNKYDHKDLSWLGNMKPGNQFLWIDEPIGYGLTLYGDGLFFTLNEALENTPQSNKKHLKRRLKEWRKDYMLEMSGDLLKYADKKVYVRR